MPGGSVGIAIYDDRVEIENPGTLPKGWNLDKLLSEHESQPQNPIIANVLYKRKVLESWGRGINLIMNECKNANLPKPEFEASGNSIKLVFRYASINNPTSTDQATDQATDQVLRLVSLLNGKHLSIKQIMKEIGLSHRHTFRTNYLHPALKNGYIVPDYPEQPNHPRQKYSLTEKGKTLLK